MLNGKLKTYNRAVVNININKMSSNYEHDCDLTHNKTSIKYQTVEKRKAIMVPNKTMQFFFHIYL